MEGILNIQSPIAFSESVKSYEIHVHQPYTVSQYKNTDEIRIAIQYQDLCVHPSGSSLHINGKITKTDGSAVTNTKFVNNAVCHLFEEIRYELNGIEIDKNKNPGLTSTMKGWASFTPAQTAMLGNAGWIDIQETQTILDDAGNFDVSIPLSAIFGSCEDYTKIVANMKHEVILIRSRVDTNAVVQTAAQGAAAPTYETVKVVLNQIEWLMPYITLSDKSKVHFYNFLGKNKSIDMGYRVWALHENPLLPTTARQSWTVKTSSQLEKPRFIILGFQTDRKDQRTQNASHFDHCNITNVKLYLNSQSYPYGNLNLKMTQNQYSILYDMYTKFQKSYYNKEPQPLLTKENFKNYMPLIIIDCSKQDESLKSAPVDIRLEFEARENFPANTAAYCLILHDRIIQYNPMSGDVRKLV